MDNKLCNYHWCMVQTWRLQFYIYFINQQLHSACVLSFQKDLKDSRKHQNPQKGVTSASQIWGTIPVKIKTQRKPYRYWKVRKLSLCNWNRGKWFWHEVLACWQQCTYSRDTENKFQSTQNIKIWLVKCLKSFIAEDTKFICDITNEIIFLLKTVTKWLAMSISMEITSTNSRHYGCIHSTLSDWDLYEFPQLTSAEADHKQPSSFKVFIYIWSWPALWSSGQGLWLLIMRSRVRFPVLPWEFFLAGKDSRGDHGLGS